MAAHFYFVAQTGVVSDSPPTVSNFYVYRLPREHQAHVELVVQADAIETAAGLEYPAEFLAWLGRHDRPGKDA